MSSEVTNQVQKQEETFQPKQISVIDALDIVKLKQLQKPKIEHYIFANPPKTKNTLGRERICCSNFFPFVLNSKYDLFTKYSIQINPTIPDDSKSYRRHLFHLGSKLIKEKLGDFFFQNTAIYSLNDIKEPISINVKDKDIDYQITLTYAAHINKSSSEILPIYKNYFTKCIRNLNFIPFKRNYFDKNNLVTIENIELWHGICPNVKMVGNNIFLNLSPITKVIRNENALSYLRKLVEKFQSHSDFQKRVNESVQNLSVLTRYNGDKSYRIEGVDFSKNIYSTFKKSNGEEIQFIDYYKQRYPKIQITDLKQPLLISEMHNNKIYLIPELCFMTGLSDEIKNDFKKMKEISNYTIGQVNSKFNECIDLVTRINNSEKCQAITNIFNISIDPNPMTIIGRELNPGNMIMSESIQIKGNKDLDRQSQKPLKYNPNKVNYILVVYRKEFQYRNIQKTFNQTAQTYSFNINCKELVIENSRNWEGWYNKISQILNHLKPHLIFVILPNSGRKGMFYDQLKTYLLSKEGIPSQIILEKTATKQNGLRSVFNKIIIQMCSKVGGIPWIIDNMPMRQEPLMIMSYSISNKNIISSVGTCDNNFSVYNNFECKFKIETKNEELEKMFLDLIKKFIRKNNICPRKIIIFREGNLNNKTIFDEIDIMKKAIQSNKDNIKGLNEIKFAYIYCNLRHNLKVTTQDNGSYANLSSGTIIDNGVIDDNKFEFYLVSQNSNQGLANSTKYTVIYDTIGLESNDIHLLIYKSCFLYYNWNKGIRVPACVQYAKRLGNIICDNMKNGNDVFLPCDKIQNSQGLFFI